jgi:hypothetical protein
MKYEVSPWAHSSVERGHIQDRGENAFGFVQKGVKRVVTPS